MGNKLIEDNVSPLFNLLGVVADQTYRKVGMVLKERNGGFLLAVELGP